MRRRLVWRPADHDPLARVLRFRCRCGRAGPGDDAEGSFDRNPAAHDAAEERLELRRRTPGCAASRARACGKLDESRSRSGVCMMASLSRVRWACQRRPNRGRGACTATTGQSAWRSTCSATLPSNRRRTPVRPCVPMTTSSAPSARAASRMMSPTVAQPDEHLRRRPSAARTGGLHHLSLELGDSRLRWAAEPPRSPRRYPPGRELIACTIWMGAVPVVLCKSAAQASALSAAALKSNGTRIVGFIRVSLFARRSLRTPGVTASRVPCG